MRTLYRNDSRINLHSARRSGKSCDTASTRLCRRKRCCYRRLISLTIVVVHGRTTLMKPQCSTIQTDRDTGGLSGGKDRRVSQRGM